MSYELANAAGQLPTFVEAWRTTHEHPHLPPTERSAGTCARAAGLFHCPSRRSENPVRAVPWSRRSLQRGAGGPGGNTHVAAVMHGNALFDLARWRRA
jgi:hypothetical protein